LVRQRTTLILSFKSLNERTLGQRVPLSRVKAMSAEEARARFTEPADQLLSGQQITLLGLLLAFWLVLFLFKRQIVLRL
jgi:hypothetical protein